MANVFQLNGRDILTSIDPTASVSYHLDRRRQRFQARVTHTDSAGAQWTAELALLYRANEFGLQFILGQDWLTQQTRITDTQISTGPSYSSVHLDGLPVIAENINLCPQSYHCQPHNRVLRGLVAGPNLWGTIFSTVIYFHPKPPTIQSTAAILLGADWCRDVAIHSIGKYHQPTRYFIINSLQRTAPFLSPVTQRRPKLFRSRAPAPHRAAKIMIMIIKIMITSTIFNPLPFMLLP
ncbi:hypothetical protein C8J56DRAFT_946215 [Mycena floridula]|nr:hypothetical protein C8J56DRAFT_946215 [Mycena floridula]